jgi:hypothetical protein
LQESSFYCPRREVVAHGERLQTDDLCYGADTVRIAPHFFIYGPNMAASSGTGGSSAEADGPAMLEAEADLLDALDRLSTADSDAAWQDAVTARDTALRRLLIAVSDMPITDREQVVTRATQALSRDHPAPPGPDSSLDGIR